MAIEEISNEVIAIIGIVILFSLIGIFCFFKSLFKLIKRAFGKKKPKIEEPKQELEAPVKQHVHVEHRPARRRFVEPFDNEYL